MSEICKDNPSKAQKLEEPQSRKKHRRRLSQDLRNELDSARQEAAERGKAAGSRLKRKTFEKDIDLFLDLIDCECSLHRTVPDIKACLRLGLGPNKTTQAVVDVIDGGCCCQRVCNGVFYKPIETLQKVLQQVTSSGFFSYLVFFSLPLFFYYSDLVVDIVLASQVTSGITISVFSWLLAFLPTVVVNLKLYKKRRLLLTKHLSESKTKAIYDAPQFKLFIPFYNTPLFSGLTLFSHGWPLLVFYQYATLMFHIKNSYSPLEQVAGHARYVLEAHNQFFRWSRFIQDTVQLILQLCVALNLGRTTNALSVKVAISCMVVSYGLVKEEMIIKSPAKISTLGWTLLFLCFAFRFLHRIICIALFVHFLTYWIILVFLLHIAMVFGLQEYDRSVYSPKDPRISFDRIADAVSSIFHYIPKKSYDHSTQSVTRALFLASILVEDFIMFFIAYLHRDEIFVGGNIDFEMVNYLAIVTLFATLSSIFLAIYYKYAHPWKWRTQRCFLE